MDIILDKDKCIGGGMCVLSAPAVFDQDDDGIAVLLDPHPPAAGRAAVRAAAVVCPAAAITVEEGRAHTV
ncbi:ferredoxin [Nonomuraea sp. NPDC059007]|uniref:ferredoxin n=1 Tax=Nonomuraea sp. NPDC059007 TaxID=3346692 RepID=UPI0036B3ABC7